jgi:hypothetical protein
VLQEGLADAALYVGLAVAAGAGHADLGFAGLDGAGLLCIFFLKS